MTLRLERKLGKLNARKRGFTLIELLVVIAIIGILAAVVLVSLNSARVRGRDARRLSDLQQISLAMELYNDQNSGVYPADTGSPGTIPDSDSFDTIVGVLVTSNLVPQVPADPLAGRSYVAQANAATNPVSYILGADLEEDNQACDSDYDGADLEDPASGTAACRELVDDNCDGDETDAIDYCICQGPDCAS